MVETLFSYPFRIEKSQIKKVLVLKLDHLGDFVLSIDSIKLLQSIFPNTEEFSVACADYMGDFAKTLNVFDNIYPLTLVSDDGAICRTHPKASWESQFDAINTEWDLVVDLRAFPDHKEPINKLKAKYKAYFSYGNESNPLVLQYSNFLNFHTNEKLLFLVHNLEYHVVDGFYPVNLPYIVCIAPFSKTPVKEVPMRVWEMVIEKLKEKPVKSIIGIGVNGDINKLQKLGVAVAPEMTKGGLVGFMNGITHFIGLDGGATHLASWMGVPTLEFMSGSVNTGEWRGCGTKTVVMMRPVYTRPCGRAFSCCNGACMDFSESDIDKGLEILFNF